MVEQIRIGLKRLGIETSPSTPGELKLPGLEDVKSDRAIRIWSGLEAKKSSALNAPFVEIQTVSEREWASLSYPEEARTVEASVLKSSFAHIYPPGVMDRAEPGTGKRPALRSLEGRWTISPAGSDGKARYAVLAGKARLTYGPDGFSYEGDFEAVIAYTANDPSARTLLGVFEAVYPRTAGRMERRSAAQVPFAAVLETLTKP